MTYKETWFEVEPGTLEGHYADWSGLLDPPAGKHGFVMPRDNKLVFESGTGVRFWGVNLVGGNCFPEQVTAKSLAARLAKMGCNLVRLHHMDAPWAVPNIFGNADDTRALATESLERLDYLVALLKQQGIYVFLDLLVHRKFTLNDGIAHPPVEDGAKQVAFMDQDLIRLQKEYARQLLEHTNAYTGIPYKEEPAVAGLCLINEATALTSFQGDIVTGPYRNALHKQWEQEGGRGNMASFQPDYGKEELAVQEEGNIPETLNFLGRLEADYYKEMHRFLLELGVQFPVGGSNFPFPFLPSLEANSVTDFMMTNCYWDHPAVEEVHDDWDQLIKAPVTNKSQYSDLRNNFVGFAARFRFYNKPFLVTEWATGRPNAFALEGIPLMAAYAAFQDWDGLCQFEFDAGVPGKDPFTSFGLSRSPDWLAQWVAAAPLYLKGLVAKADHTYVAEVDVARKESLPAVSTAFKKHPFLPFVTHTALSFDQAGSGKPEGFMANVDGQRGIVRTSPESLMLDTSRRQFRLNNAYAVGMTGPWAGITIDWEELAVTIENAFVSFMVVSGDGNTLANAETWLMVVAGPVQMEGEGREDGGKRLASPGAPPVWAQVIRGNVHFRTRKPSKITPRHLSGASGKPLKLQKGGLNLEQGRSMVYEVMF